MQPTVYRHDRSKTRRSDFAMLAFCLLFGLFSLTDYGSEYPEWGSISRFNLVLTMWFSVVAILWLLKMAGLGFLGRKWAQVHLSLDDDGLTYASDGLMRTRRWSWAELSAFEYQGPTRLRRPRIWFRPFEPSVMDRLTMDRTRSGMRKCLPDHFDVPPEEIAAKLNEYRARALAGKSAKAPG